MDESDALGVAVGGAGLVRVEVGQALVQAGLKREAKGLGERPYEETHHAPVVATKVVGFALRFTLLVQGDDPRHAPSILDPGGMVAYQNRAALDPYRDLLIPDEMTPMGDEVLETPSRGVKKVQQAMVVGFIHEAEAAKKRRDPPGEVCQ
jgi:hypothetical protein